MINNKLNIIMDLSHIESKNILPELVKIIDTQLTDTAMDSRIPAPTANNRELKATYEDMMTNQISLAKEKSSNVDLQKIIAGTNTWEVS